MSGVDAQPDLKDWMSDMLRRVVLLERRLTIEGGGGSASSVAPGTGIDVSEAGAVYTVSVEPTYMDDRIDQTASQLDGISITGAGTPASPFVFGNGPRTTRRMSTTGTTLATTATTVIWDTAGGFPGSFFTYSAGVFTCVIPGVYQIITKVGFSSVAAENSIRAQIQVNSAMVDEGVDRRIVAQGKTVVAFCTVDLIAGDTVRVQCICSTAGGTIDTNPGRSAIELTRLS